MQKEIIIQPEIKFTAVGFTTPIVTDDAGAKTIHAKFNLLDSNGYPYDYPPLLLWDANDYDNIMWTNQDIVNRIEEILTQQS